MRRHVVLVGLSGSGKSVAGQAAARIVDGKFVDIDEEIERREGISIREIFQQRGEQAFRRLERELVGAVLAGEPSIVATGGGWAAEPGNVDDSKRAPDDPGESRCVMKRSLCRYVLVVTRTSPLPGGRGAYGVNTSTAAV